MNNSFKFILNFFLNYEILYFQINNYIYLDFKYIFIIINLIKCINTIKNMEG